ncbi:DUF6766 family protein [Luteimonas sp. SDU101]|uniref:DUF6766 family protein n=1 Tax=Luteimonas sp. SDU101 TaxID=3422593 RepID=UPI003EBB0367
MHATSGASTSFLRRNGRRWYCSAVCGEFLAVFAIVVLSIFLRQDKSPESKPLRAPHAQTGN